MTVDDTPPIMSVEKAGELVGMSQRSAYPAAAPGELPKIRLGRRLLIPTARLFDPFDPSDGRLVLSAAECLA